MSLDTSDFNVFDIKTELDMVEDCFMLEPTWEKIKKGESYKSISIPNLKAILAYKDEIKKELAEKRKTDHEKWLQSPEGKMVDRAIKADREMYILLMDIEDEMEIRREIHKVRKYNKEQTEFYNSPEFIKIAEARMYDGKQETIGDLWTKTHHYWEWIQRLKAGEKFDPPLMEEPKQTMECSHQELLNKYNQIIKDFRMKGINLK